MSLEASFNQEEPQIKIPEEDESEVPPIEYEAYGDGTLPIITDHRQEYDHSKPHYERQIVHFSAESFIVGEEAIYSPPTSHEYLVIKEPSFNERFPILADVFKKWHELYPESTLSKKHKNK